LNPASNTAAPAADASGAFLGIPYGWPLALAILVAIVAMWFLRDPLRAMIRQTFIRWGFWLVDHGRKARLVTARKIAAQRAEEIAERMLVFEDRLGRQAVSLPKETNAIIGRLDASANALDGAAKDLTEVNVEEVAERALRHSMLKIDEGRGLSKIEKNTAQAAAKGLREQLGAVRPSLAVLKAEAPRLREAAKKLEGIESRFRASVDGVNKNVAEFEAKFRSDDYKSLVGGQSIVVPWLIGMLIMVIALSGVFLNFFLIERPMAEIVGEGAKIAGVGLPTFAAMIVIFLEFVAGVVLMDAAGFTKLIPTFQTMSDGSRRVMFWVAMLFLTLFSVLEVSLAIVREQIIEANQETSRQALELFTQPAPVAPVEGADAATAPGAPAETPAEQEQGLQLITMAQIILAALIPWLLATAALPLETIIRNSVFIVQMVGAGLMLVGGRLLRGIGQLLLALYDVLIFAPLWVERRFSGRRGPAAPRAQAPEEDEDIPAKPVREKKAKAQPMPDVELQKAS
jgi:hypothetical protein